MSSRDLPEPLLTEKDHQEWSRFAQTALRWARTSMHQRRVERARQHVISMYEEHPEAYLAWSAGKDSTAMVHLAVVECGKPIRAASVKDDLDFPEEEAYLKKYAEAWGVQLDIIRPPFSLQEWVRKFAEKENFLIGQDIHSRTALLSKKAFYPLIEEYAQKQGKPGVYLGLRAEESKGRAANYRFRGAQYAKKNGEVVCQPLAVWTGLDVFAYLLTRDIEPLHIYRCVRFVRPDLIRKSWWLPGQHENMGGAIWLKTYYPSLWQRLCEILPVSPRYA